MRTLVTGGAGFIGSTLVDRLLAEDHDVDVVDDLSSGSLANLETARRAGTRFAFTELDICDERLAGHVAARRPEIVFHLAAQASVAVSVADPLTDATVNVLGTVRVLEAARQAGATKVVAAASGGTLYGETERAELPIDETHAQAPASPYGITKRTMIDYLACYQRLYGLDYAALALANVYGPRQDPHGEAGVVAIFADNLVQGTPSMVNGDGEQTRDFVYVGDVVDAFVRAMTPGPEGIFNIGTGVETSVNELYAEMAAAAGSSLAAAHGPPRSGDIRFSALDPARATAVLGWRATMPLGEGLSAVLAHHGVPEPA